MSQYNNGGSSSHETAAQNTYSSINFNIQLTLPTLPLPTAEEVNFAARKKEMQYEYLENPVEPTGRQNQFVLRKLKEIPSGITTVDFTAMGVADPRPRIRDLRGLGWRIETIQDDPHDVGRYVLMTGGCIL